MYADLHASETSARNFIYGNFQSYLPKLAKAMLLPKLLTMNSLHFNYADVNFNPMNFLEIKGKITSL